MPIVNTAWDWKQAQEGLARGGVNLRVSRYNSSYHNTTIGRYSDGHVYLNLNPGIVDQPENGYEYMPIAWDYDTHVGVCLHEYERNGYNDSDFYMVVWDETTQAPKSIEFATTRAGCGSAFSSRPDATPEIQAKYEAYQAEQHRLSEAAREDTLRRTPAKGKTLKVVRGRKVKIGTTGVCFWRGGSQFGERVGLKDEQGNVWWTALTNVEVVLPAQPKSARQAG